MSQYLSERWGQQVIVENRPGAGGVAGAASIAQSPPDGYSLLFSQSAALSLSPHVIKPTPYDVERDFEPIIFVGMVPFVLAANDKQPVSNLSELIAYAKKNRTRSPTPPPRPAARRISPVSFFREWRACNCSMCPMWAIRRAIQDTPVRLRRCDLC